MVSAGIDAGSECLKIVLLDSGRILHSSSLPYGERSVLATAESALSIGVTQAGIKRDSISRIIATGRNREQIKFAHEFAAEPVCCAQGLNSLHPSVKTVVDLGYDKCAAFKIRDGGVLRIARSEKCAAGTGRFLAVISNLLGVSEEEAGDISLKSRQPAHIEAYCTVFVESEIISLIHQGHSREDILKGAFDGLARRIFPQLLKVGLEKNVAMIGGMACNTGVVLALEQQLGFKFLSIKYPAVTEALGAAIIGGKG